VGLSSLALSDADVLYASLPSFKKPNDIPTGMTTPKTSLLLAHCRLQTLQYCTELLAQAVSKIEGLEGCPCLEQLWLNENEIKAIQGLDLCPQLRRLYLYSNRITAIQGLGALHKLEVRIAALSHVLHQCIDVAQPGLLMFELDLHCSFLGCASGTACIGIVQPKPLILSIRESLGPQERPLVACTRSDLLQTCTKAPCPSRISCHELSGGLAGCKRANSAPSVREVQAWDIMQNGLQVLWLADNQISYIAGLSHLTALHELNLARNLIEVVSDTLEANTALHTLNLADTRLGSFKQVCL